MVTKLSKRITTYFIGKGLVDKGEQDVYIYCFELLVATILNIVPILIIGFATSHYLETAIYLIVFAMLRTTAGGYHAGTHFRCAIILILNFSIFVVMYNLINYNAIKIISCVFAVAGSIIVVMLAPIDNPDNRVAQRRKKTLKIRSIVLLAIFLAAHSLLLIFNVKTICFAISYTIFSVSISMISALLKNKLIERRTRI